MIIGFEKMLQARRYEVIMGLGAVAENQDAPEGMAVQEPEVALKRNFPGLGRIADAITAPVGHERAQVSRGQRAKQGRGYLFPAMAHQERQQPLRAGDIGAHGMFRPALVACQMAMPCGDDFRVIH